jgi:hypothetical protein
VVPLVEVRPEGVSTVIDDVIGDCVANRGSALSVQVVVVPSGIVCVLVPV